MLQQKLIQGEKFEASCYAKVQGFLSESKTQRRITLDINGNLDIYDTSELQQNLSIEGKQTMYDLKLHNLIQVIYGRLSDKDDYKLTLVMDIFTLGFKEREDISEEFYFWSKS